MISPNCPDHGRLVLDLALGRLDDEAAGKAESVSESCPVCRAWWHEHFESDAAQAVDDVVAVTFSDLQLPARRRSHRLMAAAAAVVMAFGVGTLWVSQNSPTVDEEVPARTVSIRTFDFEVPEAVSEFAMIEVPDPDPAPIAHPAVQPVVPQNTVIAAGAPVAVEESSAPLFAGGFETGDLSAWVPST